MEVESYIFIPTPTPSVITSCTLSCTGVAGAWKDRDRKDSGLINAGWI